MEKRGQFATEYLVVVGFILLLVFPLSLIAFEHITSTYEDVNNNQVGIIARKITDGSNSVYYMGYPSAQTVRVYMPAGISSIRVNGRPNFYNG